MREELPVKKMERPRLKSMTDHLATIRSAVHDVVLAASGLEGVISGHADTLEAISPGMAASLRKVAAKYSAELEAARQKIYDL